MTSKWDERFSQLCLLVASWSKDPSTKVGAVIVDNNNRILGVGYNGFPRGISDLKERYEDKPTKYRMVVHAEANGILNSTGNVQDATLYVSPLPPCCECSKLIIQAGITKVKIYAPIEISDKWKNEFDFSSEMLTEAGIELSFV